MKLCFLFFIWVRFLLYRSFLEFWVVSGKGGLGNDFLFIFLGFWLMLLGSVQSHSKDFPRNKPGSRWFFPRKIQ